MKPKKSGDFLGPKNRRFLRRETKSKIVRNLQMKFFKIKLSMITMAVKHTQNRLHINKLNKEINERAREFAFKKGLDEITNAGSRKLILDF